MSECIYKRGDGACRISTDGEVTEYCVERGLPVVIATTGQTEEELSMIRDAAGKIPVFFASNYSLGVVFLIETAKKAAALFPNAEIEIVETHHDRKIDAPSGTALSIAKALQEVRGNAELNPGRSGIGKRTPTEIGIHSLRLGNIVGIHEVILNTGTQSITLKHEAFDRALFADGALAAVRFMEGKDPGLYDMNCLMEES